ncbi:ATP-binding protein [uncultured Fibrella sp.]|uniref:hybrid sensor histidine kinase/response regulator transcription factor n=1 Tax=uncultured Fibrella sp. TaxID=1284596 RepID=UPI0035CC877E
MITRQWFLTIALAWAQFLLASAQTSKTLTTADGLPNSTVTEVVQDRAGFIWIGTADGLGRYDGRTVKVFRHKPGDTTSLADNKVTQLVETAAGDFLIGLESGSFQLFDPVTERFTTLLDERFLAAGKAAVTQCRLSADGRHVWGLQPGVHLVHYDRLTKKLVMYPLLSLIGEINTMSDMVLTASGFLYGICSAGLLQLNTKTGQKRIINCPFTVRNTGFRSVDHDIVEGPNGQIVLFGYVNVALYDPVKDRFQLVPIPDPVAANPVYYSLNTLSDRHLYVGYTDRLYRLGADNRLTLTQRVSENGRPGRAHAVLLDRSGTLWRRAITGGLIRVDQHAMPFQFHATRKSILEDFIEADLGRSPPDSLLVWPTAWWPRFVRAPNQDGYLVDPGRVYRYRPGLKKLEEIRSLRRTDNRECCKLALKASTTGRLWLYSNDLGLIESNLDGEQVRFYPGSRLPLTGPYPGYDVTDIQPIGNAVWLGSRLGLGLFQYDLTKQRIIRVFRNEPGTTNSLPHNTIHRLTPDPFDPAKLWISMGGDGLCQLDTRTYTFRRLGEREGFPGGTVQSLEADANGFLWCSTTRGLVRLNPKTWAVRQFTVSDGLVETEFAIGSSAVLPDGRLMFGSSGGRTVFDPLAIRNDVYEPPLVLTSLKINNIVADANQVASVLPRPINALSELVLSYTQNFLTFEFAGLQYNKPENIVYRYRLSGVDANWVVAGKQNTANYTQLAPGRYVFEVNSSNTDGLWTRQIKRIVVLIKPPFWATWWAYAAYAVAVGGVVFGIVRLRISRIREQQNMQMKQREAEQLKAVDEVKTRFFSNITHEFRTPLSLILTPTEKLLQEAKHDAATRQTLASVHRNAGQLLGLINQLLDLSKLEAGHMAVSLARGNVAGFIEQLVDSFRPAADQKEVRLLAQVTLTEEEFAFDADKWLTIGTNLLANALKFTPAGGQIRIRLTDGSEQMLCLVVADTGIGIEAAKLPHIFNRFYQVDDTRTRAFEGTGIGLSLVSELVNVLGGTITVASKPGSGTTFTVLLPVANALAGSASFAMGPVATNRILPTYTGSRSDAFHAPGAANRPMVLVVEDNAELRHFLADELVGSYRVLTAADGQEGWQLAQTELPDVVISDVMMPGMDGYELTQRLKSNSMTSHVAVMLLTARTARESRMEALGQGADDYLTKPFHLDEVHQRLHNLISRQQTLRDYYHAQFIQPDANCRAEGMEDKFLRHLHEVVDAHLSDSTFGVEELAHELGVSRRTLNRKLSTIANQSANDVLRQQRLKRAASLLLAGGTIAETAYQVGYESPAHFSLIFKEFFQKTPTEFAHRST